MTDEYIKIAWSDVQPGDIIMHENGDRLTVEELEWQNGYNFESREVFSRAFTTLPGDYMASLGELAADGFTPHRPVPSLDAVPTEPGAYLDTGGVLCVLTGDLTWPWKGDALDVESGYFASNEMRHRAPFTRLVPMPTEERVESAILPEVRGSDRSDAAMRATAAVMSLLSGEANSTEVE